MRGRMVTEQEAFVHVFVLSPGAFDFIAQDG